MITNHNAEIQIATAAAAPQTDHLAAMVRAYVPVPGAKKTQGRAAQKAAPPSEWVLVLDTETTADAYHSLRFGTYQLRKKRALIEGGLFYDPEGLTTNEVSLLEKYAFEHAITLLTRSEFTENVFYGKAYDLRATIVGFNLPFDIARLAIRHNSARGKMKGGFTLQLSNNPRRARVQVRHLNSRSAFIQFAMPPVQRTPRGARRRGIYVPGRRGAFLDLRTIGAALFSRGFSLKSLADHLGTAAQKHEAEAHGAPLTETYVRYALQDAEVTWECFEALSKRFADHGLSQTPISKIQSEASIGKAYLREMGIRPFFEMQPDFPSEIMGKIMSTYFGGRTEVRWRRSVKQVVCCDFLSMYPTVCTLMRLWKFVIAKGMTWRDTTEETQALLNDITTGDLQRPKTWLQLHTIVELMADADILPLRAKYNGTSATIGLNCLTSEVGLSYTLADVIASKLLTGKAPRILRAITFYPVEPQSGLRSVRIGGSNGPKIDPLTCDFYKQLIDLRTVVRDKMKGAPPSQKGLLDAEQQALKILANSTSYGIFVEFNVTDLDSYDTRTCFGPSGDGFSVQTKKSEVPGPFLHPLIAALITGAARLMLAAAEALIVEADLDWAFCDTDSIAIAKPDTLSTEVFIERTKRIVRFFEALNPYEKLGPLLKIEAENYSDSGELETLYALCVSSKRYALFNQGGDGSIIIRRASAHGLGHLMAPYGAEEAPSSLPTPREDVDDIPRWQHDLWHQIMQATLDGHPDEVDLEHHPSLRLPAMSRYGATTPVILRWFDKRNRGKPYREQVKPFGFLVAFQANPFTSAPANLTVSVKGKRKKSALRPVAPFNPDPQKAAQNALDRQTGVRLSASSLKSFGQGLAQYHLSPETKFHNGDFTDVGRTERRHIKVLSVQHIGKEANNWEKQFFLGVEEGDQIEYGGRSHAGMEARLDKLCERLGEREVARQAGISRMSLRKARRLLESVCLRTKQRLSRVAF